LRAEVTAGPDSAGAAAGVSWAWPSERSEAAARKRREKREGFKGRKSGEGGPGIGKK
jgi:hypothetical protein